MYIWFDADGERVEGKEIVYNVYKYAKKIFAERMVFDEKDCYYP